MIEKKMRVAARVFMIDRNPHKYRIFYEIAEDHNINIMEAWGILMEEMEINEAMISLAMTELVQNINKQCFGPNRKPQEQND